MRYQERPLTVDLSQALLDKTFNNRLTLLTTDTGSGKTFIALRTAYLLDPNAHLLIFMPKAKQVEGGWEKSLAAFNEVMGSTLTADSFSYSQLTTKNGPDDIQQAIQNQIQVQHYIQVPVTVTAKDTTFSVSLKEYLDSIPGDIHSIRVEEAPFKKSTGAFRSFQTFHGDVNTKTIKAGEETFNYILRVDTDFLDEADRPKLILILDEAHMIKLGTSGTLSQRAKAAINLAQSPSIHTVLGITATPAPNSPMDYGTYFVINGNYANKTDFLKQHIKIYDQYHTPVVRNPYTKQVSTDYFKDYDRIESLVHDLTVYTDTSYVLPDSTLETVSFTLDDTETFVFPYFEDHFFDDTQRTRKGHYKEVLKYARRGYFEDNQTALAVLRTLITEDPSRIRNLARLTYDAFYGDHPHPVIVFYKHNLEKDAIIRFFHENQHFPDVTIQQVNAKYKEVDTPKHPETLILIQYQAGAAAIEFQTAYTTVFFMPTYSYGDFKQGRGRNIRSGMTGVVHQYILQADNTLDEDIWRIITEKGNFTHRMEDQYFTVEGPWNQSLRKD